MGVLGITRRRRSGHGRSAPRSTGPRPLIILGCVLATATGVTAGAVPAAAAPPGAEPAMSTAAADATVLELGGESLNVRSAPTLTATVVGTVTTGQQVSIDCQADGPQVVNDIGGYTSTLWDHLPALGGYVSDAWVYTGHDGRIPGVPDCASEDPDPEPPSGPCDADGFPSGASTAAIVEQMEQRWPFDFVDDDLSWTAEPNRPLLEVWWDTLGTVGCTPFLDGASRHNPGGRLTIRAHTHPDDTWGWYRGGSTGLQMDLSKMRASLDAGNTTSVEQNIVHELGHSYNADRDSGPAYWTEFTGLHAAYGGISLYGADGYGGVTENISEVVGFFVARCADETFYRNPDVDNPFDTDSAATRAYFAFARDRIFGGATFGPAPGTTPTC